MFVWKWSWKVSWSLSFLMCNCKDLGLQAFQCAIARILVFKLFDMQLQRSHQSLSFLILVFELSDMQVSDQSLSFLTFIANQAVVYYLWIFWREISITRICQTKHWYAKKRADDFTKNRKLTTSSMCVLSRNSFDRSFCPQLLSISPMIISLCCCE